MEAKRAVWALLPMLLVVLARLAGPMSVDDTDQSKQALYLVDVMENGNWVLPMERGVEPATKPPVLTWIAVLFCAPLGVPDYFVARLPSGIAALVLAWLIFRIASERWNPSVGLAAAWILAATHPLVLLCTHFRTDMLLAALVVGTLFALHRLEQGFTRGRAWLFWATLSAAIFVKGPPGLIVAGGAVGTLMFSPRWRAILKPALLFPGWTLLLIPLVWFVLAYGVGGNPYVKYTVVRETVDRVTGSGTRAHTVQHPPGYLLVHFLAKSAPWSFLAFVGVFLALRKKGDPETRNKFMLMAAWMCAPLFLFNLSKGQRPDYLVPLLPAAAAMAAALLLDPSRPGLAKFWRLCLAFTAAGALGLSISALGGLSFGSKALRQLAEDGGAVWGLGLAAVAGLAAAGLLLRRTADAPSPGILLGILSILLLNVLYTETVSPGARSGRGEAMADFGERVRRERKPGDELKIYGVGITNGVHYHLGLNQPAVPGRILPLYFDRTLRPGRLLVATTDGAANELLQTWPGRFDTLVRIPQGRDTHEEYVLLALK